MIVIIILEFIGTRSCFAPREIVAKKLKLRINNLNETEYQMRVMREYSIAI